MQMVSLTRLIGAGLLALAGTSAGAQDAAHEVVFQCDGGRTITVTFADGSASLRTRDTTVVLDGQPVASGIHYMGGGHDLRGKGPELVWSEPTGDIRMCRDQEWAMKQPQVEPPQPGGLAGTSWALVHFQSSDDTIGIVVPPRLNRYSLSFGTDGALAMRLDCNRGTAKWEATPTSPTGGGLSIGPAAMTRAACGEGSLDVRLAQDMGKVRSYTLADGMLNLALEADAGIYVWKPANK